jgi:hypothetical protein
VSFSYNTIQILPGALVVVIGQERLVRTLDLGRWPQLSVRVVLLVLSGFVFLYTFNTEGLFPVDGLGLALLLGLAAAAGSIGLWRRRRGSLAPGPSPAS